MRRREDKKRNNRRIIQEDDGKKFITDKAANSIGEWTPTTDRDSSSTNFFPKEKAVPGEALTEAQGKINRERIKSKYPVESESVVQKPDEGTAVNASAQNCGARLQHNLDQLHFDQSTSIVKDIGVGDVELRNPVSGDWAECNFETSIDEASLKSFLDISGSPLEKDNPPPAQYGSESQYDTDISDTDSKTQTSVHVHPRPNPDGHDSGENNTVVKRCSDKSAKTSDSFHTALMSPQLAYSAIPKSKTEREEPYGKKTCYEADGEVGLKGIGCDVTLRRRSGSMATRWDHGCAWGRQLQEAVCTSDTELDTQKVVLDTALINRRKPKSRVSSLLQSPERKNVHYEEDPLTKDIGSSPKSTNKVSEKNDSSENGSNQTRTQPRIHTTCSTRVSKGSHDSEHLFDPTKQERLEGVTKSTEYRRKAMCYSKENKELLDSKGYESVSKRRSAILYGRPGLKSSKKTAKPTRDKLVSSLTHHSTATHIEGVAGNDRKGNTRKDGLLSAGKRSLGKRVSMEPQRLRQRNVGNSSKLAHCDKGDNLKGARYISADIKPAEPIVSSSEEGFCINGNALAQIEHGIMQDIHKVFIDIQRQIDRECHKEKDKKGWKLLVFRCGK